ncbi:MAG: gliding motility-associated protein GldE [Prevotella sp.]|nr:gliding motility-associated protein GldE [Prevotella sp.]
MDIQEILMQVHVVAPSTGAIIAGLIALFLLVVSGFASGSEIAFFSLSPADLRELEEGRHSYDHRILELYKDSERTLATILITNNLVNVTIIMLLNFFIANVIDFGGAYWLQFLTITVFLTFLLLLFGEIMPKVYSGQHPLMFCRKVVNGIVLMRRIFWWFSSVLIRSGILASKVLQHENRKLSVDDLEQALELTDKEDIREEKKMLEGIVKFSDEQVKEVMTSRQDIVDIDYNSTFSEVLKCIVDNNYSRIPVYQNGIDNIKGVLYVKDLLPHLDKGDSFKWQTLIRPAYFVPETKMIDDLMRDFQKNKVHMAIVVDEFGGTCGLITLEDILEEIVGEINDEFDEDEKQYQRLNANTFIFEGKTLLGDFEKIINIDGDELDGMAGDADTLAGLLLEIKGEFPSLHEVIVTPKVTFEVMEMNERRISKIKVVLKSK